MTPMDEDRRSIKRRAQDEKIAAELPLPPLDVPSGTTASQVEFFLGKSKRHPVALAGIVENGVVRIVDTSVKLPERSRVIIVAESA